MRKGGSDSDLPLGVCVLNNHPSMKLFVFSQPLLRLLASNGRKYKDWPCVFSSALELATIRTCPQAKSLFLFHTKPLEQVLRDSHF